MNYQEILELIEEMQYDLERKVEWSLTEALPYDEVKDKIAAAQVALNDLYVYIMEKAQ